MCGGCGLGRHAARSPKHVVHQRTAGCRTLRSAGQPLGLPDLNAADAQQLATGNMLASHSAAFAKAAYERQNPGGEENPHSSFLWKLPSRIAQLGSPNAVDCVADHCACGRAFRARTRCRMWHCRPAPQLAAMRCKGRGICDFSGEPHLRLTGVSAGGFKTAAEVENPPQLCSALASSFVTAYAAKRSARLWNPMR